MTAALELEEIRVSFARSDVVRGVSLLVPEGTIVALLGPNGGGKTVTSKAAAGLVPLRRGSIRLGGRDVTSMTPERRVALGLRYLPQVGGIVPRLTVSENLRLGAYLLRRRRGNGRYKQVLADVIDRFPFLSEKAGAIAGTLSAGQQRMLALARTLMSEPKVLVADEPSAGLAQGALAGLAEVLAGRRGEGASVLLVEQNVTLARALADWVVVLDHGAVVYREPASALDDQRLASLLGVGLPGDRGPGV